MLDGRVDPAEKKKESRKAGGGGAGVAEIAGAKWKRGREGERDGKREQEKFLRRGGCGGPSRSFSLNFETGRRTISTTSIPLHGRGGGGWASGGGAKGASEEERKG